MNLIYHLLSPYGTQTLKHLQLIFRLVWIRSKAQKHNDALLRVRAQVNEVKK